MLNILMYYTPPEFYPFILQHFSCKHAFSIRVENSVDPDQMALSEASLSGSTVFFFQKRINQVSAGKRLN